MSSASSREAEAAVGSAHYRVWQANREIFLYPENYVDPALRRFKTPQFAQLESNLQQGNLTPALIDSAVSSYLKTHRVEWDDWEDAEDRIKIGAS